MEVYHHSDNGTTAVRGGARPVPYAYTVIPPVGRLLILICEHVAVGGCFRPGNRKLADWLGYASAGQMPYLLSQLACDGWIRYDSDSRLITLLRDPESDPPIRSIDQDEAIESIDQRSVDQIDSDLIDPIDRGVQQQDAEYRSDRSGRSIPQRMEDYILTTTESFSEPVVVTKIKIPCGDDSISSIDHPTAQLLSELGAGRGVTEKALAARDWTREQILARWEYDQERIRTSGGKLTEGIFWTALMDGQLAPGPRAGAVDWAAIALAQAPPPADAGESLRDHALRITPPDISGRDFQQVLRRLGEGASDTEVLSELDKRRKRGER